MIESGALFSADRAYRYRLWRKWAEGPTCTFLMLNPSTADEVDNDPTVERCERRARSWGYGTLLVANIFAYRSTDPAALLRVSDPVGPLNDATILQCAEDSKLVVCAWGSHGSLRGRSSAVRKLLHDHRQKLHTLAVTQGGEPRHPLYLPYSCMPQAMYAR